MGHTLQYSNINRYSIRPTLIEIHNGNWLNIETHILKQTCKNTIFFIKVRYFNTMDLN